MPLLGEDAVYLKCDKEYRTRGPVEHRKKLIKLNPGQDFYVLDKNLEWDKDGGLVDLDEYFMSYQLVSYWIDRYTLRLKVSGFGDEYGEFDCSQIEKKQMDAIIERIKTSKLQKQKI